VNQLLPIALSSPAERVTPAEPANWTIETFSRSLDQRNPHTRSSTALIVPMDSQAPMHFAERLVLRASILAGAAVFIRLIAERLWP